MAQHTTANAVSQLHMFFFIPIFIATLFIKYYRNLFTHGREAVFIRQSLYWHSDIRGEEISQQHCRCNTSWNCCLRSPEKPQCSNQFDVVSACATCCALGCFPWNYVLLEIQRFNIRCQDIQDHWQSLKALFLTGWLKYADQLWRNIVSAKVWSRTQLDKEMISMSVRQACQFHKKIC